LDALEFRLVLTKFVVTSRIQYTGINRPFNQSSKSLHFISFSIEISTSITMPAPTAQPTSHDPSSPALPASLEATRALLAQKKAQLAALERRHLEVQKEIKTKRTEQKVNMKLWEKMGGGPSKDTTEGIGEGEPAEQVTRGELEEVAKLGEGDKIEDRVGEEEDEKKTIAALGLPEGAVLGRSGNASAEERVEDKNGERVGGDIEMGMD
jgi:hypothetical protein